MNRLSETLDITVLIVAARGYKDLAHKLITQMQQDLDSARRDEIRVIPDPEWRNWFRISDKGRLTADQLRSRTFNL